MSVLSVPLVANYRQIAESALQAEALQVLEKVRRLRAASTEDATSHNYAIDSAFRELFIELISTLDIEHDDFDPVWSLLDSVNLLCDNGLCEHALGFWLVEDLLDSQTINGCRHVFHYLESRRERMTKINFKQKHLPILRCCNELLRRLSRAEDTVFCGRVFIYLFQSFPLGDKSSVNLRGEFHVENVTIYDELPLNTDATDETMEVEQQETGIPTTTGSSQTIQKKSNLNDLYPIFWSLQSLFSFPTKLFEKSSMDQFKDAIQQTLSAFRQVSSNTTTAAMSDPDKRGLKRKRGNLDTEHAEMNASAFNPKYLTNRDLFDLEIHDIEFRRHVLVQALILLDFLLGLSVQGKAKLSAINKQEKKSTMSALYDKYTLSEDDVTWALETRKTIEKYLEEGNGTEGRYYLRMVNMVLSRDKNWVFWKAEGCPPISKDPVESDTEKQSQQSLQQISADASRPLLKPKGADQLAFLSHNEPVKALMEKRYDIPTLEEYYKSIRNDDLDLDFADNDEERRDIEERKAGKLWRALRSAHGKRFTLCEDIKNGENLDALIGKVREPEPDGEEPAEDGESVAANAQPSSEPIQEKQELSRAEMVGV